MRNTYCYRYHTQYKSPQFSIRKKLPQFFKIQILAITQKYQHLIFDNYLIFPYQFFLIESRTSSWMYVTGPSSRRVDTEPTSIAPNHFHRLISILNNDFWHLTKTN